MHAHFLNLSTIVAVWKSNIHRPLTYPRVDQRLTLADMQFTIGPIASLGTVEIRSPALFTSSPRPPLSCQTLAFMQFILPIVLQFHLTISGCLGLVPRLLG